MKIIQSRFDGRCPHCDREAERAEPITREWLESIGFDSRGNLSISDDFILILMRDVLTLHVEDCEPNTPIFRLPLPHITTRGQVLDLLRVLGVKI